MSADRFTIDVRNWEKFQHPDVARGESPPPWIRLYTQLHSDEAFLELSAHLRAVLFGIWVEYARSRRHLSVTTASLSRRLNLRVMRRDLDALNHAGFIEILQAERPQRASLDQIRQDQTDLSNAVGGSPTGPPKQATPGGMTGNTLPALARRQAQAQAKVESGNDGVADELLAARRRRQSSFAQVVEEAANSP